jgi:hypothetical protein
MDPPDEENEIHISSITQITTNKKKVYKNQSKQT